LTDRLLIAGQGNSLYVNSRGFPLGRKHG